MDSDEFTHWIAYNQIDPFGNERADHHAAMVAYVTAQKGSKKKLKFQDFLLKFEKPKRMTKAQDIMAYFRNLSNGSN